LTPFIVTTTVKLDSKASSVTIEVHDISADWVLTTELVAAQTLISQVIPEELLSVGLPLSKFASSSK